MRTLTPEQVRPLVRIASFNRVEGISNWGPRRIVDLELILVTAGRFSYRSATEYVEAAPGGLIFFEPGLEHIFRLESEVDGKGFWYMHLELLRGARYSAGDYRLEPRPPRVTDVTGDRPLEDCFRRCTEALSGYGKYRDAILEASARELWLRLAEHWAGRAFRELSPRTRDMVNWLRNHLSDPISRQELARRYYITPEHVNAIFKRELGISPTQFIHRERVLLANRLMVTRGLTAKEAARRVGFCDQFYFSKVFKKVMGVPPSRA